MNTYICPNCDNEIELAEVETYQDDAGARTLTEYNTWYCPHCGKSFSNYTIYDFRQESELVPID